MQGQFIDLLSTDAGLLAAYCALPASGSGPAVVVLQEIFGVNEAMRAVADDLAAQGYVAFVPDLFHRLQPRVELGYDEGDTQSALGLWKRFDLEQGVADVTQVIEAVRARPEVSGGVALLGFCLGGQLAVKTAAKVRVDAMLCFYGTRLGDCLDEIAVIEAPALFHVGDADPHAPLEVRAALAALAADRPHMTLIIYPGAAHAFFNAYRPGSFRPEAHERARTQSLALLREALLQKA